MAKLAPNQSTINVKAFKITKLVFVDNSNENDINTIVSSAAVELLGTFKSFSAV